MLTCAVCCWGAFKAELHTLQLYKVTLEVCNRRHVYCGNKIDTISLHLWDQANSKTRAAWEVELGTGFRSKEW